MPEAGLPAPAFGQADLTNCEREQIHFAGSIQPHGALLVVDERDFTILQTSANAAEFLGVSADLLGRPVRELGDDLFVRIQPHLSESISKIPFGVRFKAGTPAAMFDAMLHRPPTGGLVIEIERPGEPIDLAGMIEPALQAIVASASLRSHCDETARIFQEITGYDRVMVYRFDEHGHGEVLSERKRADLESYLGNWYPASDIPQIARRLYERNRIRVLVDVTYEPVPLVPRGSPLTGEELDMSLCILRSSSPIHLQYLRNMGVAATLVISLMVGGRLWGLIACHHYRPKFVNFESRAICEVLAEAVATRIAALETFAQARAEMYVRRLERRMIEAISREGDWRSALFESPQALLQPLRATGAALVYDGQVMSTGEVPGTQELREISAWLGRKHAGPIFASATFADEFKAFPGLSSVAAGIAAVRVSNSPDDRLFWFRPERIRTVTWGGDPSKPVEIGISPADLSPRRSFAQWHQLVVGTSEAWTQDDLATARLIGDAVADVALQYQSVRSLIIQDQMRQVNRTVSISEHPVVTADANGEIIFANDSFKRLLGSAAKKTRRIADFAKLFKQSRDIADRLRELLVEHRNWRGEVWLTDSEGRERPLMVRADIVMASPDRVIGYVFLFTDLTERKVAETARRRFQDGIVERYSVKQKRLDSESDLVYRRLLSSVVENAQVAALEIAESEQVSNIPVMLDSVSNSVSRAAEVLETLVWHAMRSAGSVTLADTAPAVRLIKKPSRVARRKPARRSKRQY